MTTRIKRPIRVTLLTVAGFLFSAWNILRLCETFYIWKRLEEYKSFPIYIALTTVIWVLVGLIVIWGLWTGKTWAWLATLGVTTAYMIWFWIDRSFIQKPPANQNWPFALTVTIFFAILFPLILFSDRTRRFFYRDTHERKSES
jgi:hypothetical protein